VILIQRASLSSLLLVSTVATQTPAANLSRRSDNPHRHSTPPSPHTIFSHEPIIYEFVRVKMRYEKDGTGCATRPHASVSRRPRGYPELGSSFWITTPQTKRSKFGASKVIKPDGSTITAGPDAVQDLSAPVTRQAPMYTDARQKHVTVPGLAVGDAIEYNAVTTSSPIIAGQFWYTWAFVAGAVSLDEQVELNVPRDPR